MWVVCQHRSVFYMSAQVSYVICQHRVSFVICQHRLVLLYASTGQLCYMSAQVSFVIRQHRSVMLYVSKGQFCYMSAQVSYVVCQHRSVLLYVSSGQFCYMSAQVSCVVCQHRSVLLYVWCIENSGAKNGPYKKRRSFSKLIHHLLQLQVHSDLNFTCTRVSTIDMYLNLLLHLCNLLLYTYQHIINANAVENNYYFRHAPMWTRDVRCVVPLRRALNAVTRPTVTTRAVGNKVGVKHVCVCLLDLNWNYVKWCSKIKCCRQRRQGHVFKRAPCQNGPYKK